MFYRRLRARLGVPAAVVISTVLWVFLLVVVIALIVGVSMFSANRHRDGMQERLEGYGVVSEHAGGGSRTEYAAMSSFSGFGNTMPWAEVDVTYEFDGALDGLDRYIELAEQEGWIWDEPGGERFDDPSGGARIVRYQGVLYGGSSYNDGHGNLYDYCDDLGIELSYFDPGGPGVLRAVVTASGRCYSDYSG